MEIESRIYEQSFSFQLTRFAIVLNYHLIKTAAEFMKPDNRLNLILVPCNWLDGVCCQRAMSNMHTVEAYKVSVGGKTYKIPLWLLRLFSIK